MCIYMTEETVTGISQSSVCSREYLRCPSCPPALSVSEWEEATGMCVGGMTSV